MIKTIAHLADIHIRKLHRFVEYRKVFFENDEDEIRKLYEFFGNEDYFDKNTNDITTKFKQYHNDNFRVWEEFDWEASNIERQL